MYYHAEEDAQQQHAGMKLRLLARRIAEVKHDMGSADKDKQTQCKERPIGPGQKGRYAGHGMLRNQSVVQQKSYASSGRFGRLHNVIRQQERPVLGDDELVELGEAGSRPASDRLIYLLQGFAAVQFLEDLVSRRRDAEVTVVRRAQNIIVQA